MFFFFKNNLFQLQCNPYTLSRLGIWIRSSVKIFIMISGSSTFSKKKKSVSLSTTTFLGNQTTRFSKKKKLFRQTFENFDQYQGQKLMIKMGENQRMESTCSSEHGD